MREDNQIQTFVNKEFGEIRAVEIDGQPWFIGKDIADVLAYKNTRDALRIHVDDEDKATVVIHDGSQNRRKTAINESGLYSLTLSSKLPSAKSFKREKSH
jgi:prophage antirepressor-like protein